MRNPFLVSAVSLIVLGTAPAASAQPSARRAATPIVADLPPYDALRMPYDGSTLASSATQLDERRIFIGRSANTNSLKTRMNSANSISLEGRIADRIAGYDATRSTLELYRTVSQGLLANGYRQRFACSGAQCDSGSSASEFQFAQSIYSLSMYDTPFKPMINCSKDIRYGVFQRPDETVIVFTGRHSDGDVRMHIASIKTDD